MTTDDERIDEAGIESFPASDAPSWTSGMRRGRTDPSPGLGVKIPKLTEAEIKAGLQKLQGWSLLEGKLHREYVFGDFAEAFGFMTRCALVAQKSDHHPEWSNVYNRVVVDLTTHDAGGVSALDFALANEMEKALARPMTQ
jgi:4a-hydroxytetrahydrobiopterin dehydratase